MTLGQIFARFRFLAGDKADPPLWGDIALTSLANEAEREACRRARLLTDSTTASTGTSPDEAPLCTVPIATDDTMLTLHPKVLFVKRVRLVTANRRIARAAARDLDAHFPGWEDETGDILAYAPDWQTGKLRWFRTPEADDTAMLTVIRLPLTDMAALGDIPEIDARFHERLADYMLYLAYEVDDTETIDPNRAMKALARFEQEFGPKSDARNETYLQNEYDFGGLDGVY